MQAFTPLAAQSRTAFTVSSAGSATIAVSTSPGTAEISGNAGSPCTSARFAFTGTMRPAKPPLIR